jgi:hypothetical protein
VIDELLDEFAGATWFSCLDLRAGYHQIRLAGVQNRISNSLGHFEFTVMAFGLTGAPNSFQGAMNTTLRPLLRKCALVFFDDILVFSKSYEEHLQQSYPYRHKINGWLNYQNAVLLSNPFHTWGM